jgi:thioredoxin-dependent peroxiredoxin
VISLISGMAAGHLAPDFIAETTHGSIRFHEWKAGSWAVLFSYPRDFTPVCTTELGAVAALMPEFERLGTKVIGLSVDPVEAHHGWQGDIARVTGCAVSYPIIADPDRRVTDLYGMIHPNASDTTTMRSTFVIGPDHRVRLSMAYPASTGRNFRELLRVLDSLQLAEAYDIVTPADWRYGEDVIITPSMSEAEVKARFPKGYEVKTGYLRVTPQPDLDAAVLPAHG